MRINNMFDIEQIVYLKTDEDQSARIVTMIQVTKQELVYQLSLGTNTSYHYEFEITEEPNLIKKLTQYET